MSEYIKHLDQNSYDEYVSSDTLTVVDFWANWCGPCRMLAPNFEEAAEELGSTVRFAKLDVDEAEDVAVGLNVMTIPTLLFYKSGEIIKTHTGYLSKDALVDIIKSLI